VICDLQRNSYSIIPNDLFEILRLYDGSSICEVKKKYQNNFDEIIDEYFEFLLDKEYVFFSDSNIDFPKLSLEWYEPFRINNAIIDYNEKIDYDKILIELNKLNCKSLEIRFFDNIQFSFIESVLLFIEQNEMILYSLGFVLKYSDEMDKNVLENFISKNPRISYVIVSNAPANCYVEVDKHRKSYVFYSQDKVDSSSNCGLISSKSFVVNTRLFTESQEFNTCLNRKISIDVEGNIKNCPSMSQSFGKIGNVTLEEVLEKPEFKKYWNVNKDQIEVCKDCEFRHICTDCRAFIEEPENQYSKPLKCGYDPYTNVWSDWSTNPPKVKAIEFYGMQELVKNNA